MGLTITCLGTGSAFTVGDNWQSNFLIRTDDREGALLVDCGGDCRHAMVELGLTYRDIEAVYVSHLHADHVGGLEWLALSTKFTPDCRRPILHVHEKMVDQVWDGTLQGGLASLEGEVASLETYFRVNAISPNGSFSFGRCRFDLVQTIHIMDGNEIVPSYGLMFDVGNQTVLLTTDTQFCPPQFRKFYAKADVILHDCETTPYQSDVHAHYRQLRTLNDETRAKMWLYHYAPGELPDAEGDGFRGFLRKGQVLEF